MILGSHLSISGGLHKALESANSYGFNAVAIFVRNQRTWKSKPLSPEAIERFKIARESTKIKYVVAHGSYLVNLAGVQEIRNKSIEALKDDYIRCGLLGIEYLVFHPGSNPDQDKGIELISVGLDKILSEVDEFDTKILLETTAGQGNCIGRRFEQIGQIMKNCESKQKLGVCLDTCHVFAAGYDLRSKQTYAKTMQEFDDEIGIKKLLAIHLNDSKNPLGSRKDRHEHIGDGDLGLNAFANIVNDRKLKKISMIMETPKGLDELGNDMDIVNSQKLYSLVLA